MAPDSGYHTSTSDVSTIITCEGTLGHPEFPRQFQKVVDRLNGLLGVPVKVRKLEPWNSVRVTLSVPREAASRLRQLAQQGASQLRALGILSVQLDGEGAISLRLQGPNGEPQEVILRTTQDGSSTNTSAPFNLGSLLPTASGAASSGAGGGGASTSSQVQFKSPNVVCPPDTVVPRVGAAMGPPQTATNTLNVNKPPYAGPFPFASMNQAIHSQSSANPSGASRSTNMEPPSFLPPPYPGMRQGGTSTVTQANQPAVTISSPLLVNLLQNDLQGGGTSTTTVANSPTANKVPELPPPATTAVVRQMRPPPPPPTGVKNQPTPPSPSTPPLMQQQQQPPIIKQSAILSNHVVSSNNNLNISNNSSTMSQSALSTQTSIASIMSGNNNIKNSSSSSSVATSTQMAAINSIANSLANAANSIAAAAANSTNASYKGPYQQQQQSAPAQQQTVVHHYQRTPQGSIIAVHKPPPVPNQSIVQSTSIPIHHQQQQQQQQQPQQRPTLPQALLRQQILSNVPPQKSAPMFVHNNVQLTHNQSRGSVMSHRIIQHNVPNQGMSAGVLGLNQCETVGTQVAQPQPSAPLVKKPLPSPPPYNLAISRNNWDLTASNLLDLAPSLTDLKPDELDDILPTLDTDALPELSELELLGSALGAGSDLCEESNSNGAASVTSLEENSQEGDGRKFLINPLTGELEAQSGGEEESDTEEVKDVFTGLPSPVGLSDDDTNSTTRPDTMTDQSDSETRSSTEGKHPRVKNSKARREGRDSPAQKPTEKIKLRLKLEKSEPINPAYKVDVSFIHAQQPKKATTSIMPPAGTSPVGAGGGGVGEELRVPPLHISLRGRNSAVIKNKTKLNPDGTPVLKKPRKTQGKGKKEGGAAASDEESGEEHKKVKKFKSNHDHKDLLASLSDHSSSPPTNTKYSLHNHYKDKQKERRGSDSELVRANSKKQDANGALSLGDDKRRRLSQSEGDKRLEQQQQEEAAVGGMPSVLGSTNVGTVAVLPQKLRKDKIKLKDTFKIKDNTRKLFAVSPKSSLPPSPPDKKPQQQLPQQIIALPTAIDVDMEAKFKQSLMEVVIGEKGIPRPPHRTVEIVGHVQSDGARMGSVGEKVPKSPVDSIQIPQKEKSPEPDKCNEPDKSSSSTGMDQEREKQLNAGRSPNSGSSGGQGEDSGIESMDALSEKSPNQASQSPHADILPNVVVAPQIASKTQVPDMLDIEAQLAKMEGLEPHQEEDEEEEEVKNCNTSKPPDIKPNSRTTEDVNENECVHRSDSKPCCELTCTLQGGLDSEIYKDPKTEEAVKNEEEEQPQQPPPPTSPALYSFSSNSVDKGGGGGGHDSRGGSESPQMTTEDEDSNMGNSQHHNAQANNKSKSLLEQLLIEIPEHHHGNAVAPSSHSPATRSSVRTRAHSKLNSPELSSPVPKNAKSAPATTTAKRKRNESDSSNHSVEDTRKRPRKGSEASDLAKRTNTVQQQQHGTAATIGAKQKNAKVAGNNALNDESSDSDEPLIEKVRKTAPKANANKGPKGAAIQAAATPASQLNNKSNTRRSLRAGHQIQQQQQQQDKQHQQEKPQLLDVKQLPAQNTRSREKVVQNQQQQPLGNNQVVAQQQQQQHHQAQNAQHSNAEADALLRRKTRSADVESKRKKEVK